MRHEIYYYFDFLESVQNVGKTLGVTEVSSVECFWIRFKFKQNYQSGKGTVESKMFLRLNFRAFVSGYVLLYFMAASDAVSLITYSCSKLGSLFSPINQHNSGILCAVLIILRGGCLGSSTLMTMMMSCERVFAAYWPFRYKNTVSVSLMTKIGYGCAAVSLLTAGGSLRFFGNDEGECIGVQKDVSDAQMLIFLCTAAVVFLLLPSLSTAVLNIFLIFKIKKRTKRYEHDRNTFHNANSSVPTFLITFLVLNKYKPCKIF